MQREDARIHSVALRSRLTSAPRSPRWNDDEFHTKAITGRTRTVEHDPPRTYLYEAMMRPEIVVTEIY